MTFLPQPMTKWINPWQNKCVNPWPSVSVMSRIRDFSKSVPILSRNSGHISDWATFWANWAILGHFVPFSGHFVPFFRYFLTIFQAFVFWQFRNLFGRYAFMNAPIFCRFFSKFGHGIKNMPHFFAELLQILAMK